MSKRTAQSVEESKNVKSVEELNKQPKYPRGQHPNSRKNLVAPWKPGEVPNPTGKNGRDVASEIAQAVFTENPEAIYKAMTKAVLKGNAYAFDVVANRAFGKLKEKLELGASDELIARLTAGRKRVAASQ